jgi:integrase
MTLVAWQEYIDQLTLSGKSASYINQNVELCHLWAECFDVAELKKIKYIKRKNTTIRTTLSDSEIEQVLFLPALPRQPHFAQWTLFFGILAFTGMRPGELAHMTVDRVDFGRAVFVLRAEDTKTNTPRLVPIPPHLSASLEKQVKKIQRGVVFPSPQGKILAATEWGRNFRERLDRCKISRNGLSVYSLRHSILTRLIDEDVNIFRVKDLAGHVRTQTTERYYHSSVKSLHNAIQKDPLALASAPVREVYGAFRRITYDFFSGKSRFFISVEETGDEIVVKVRTT